MTTQPFRRVSGGITIDQDRIVREALEESWRVLRHVAPSSKAMDAVALALALQEGPARADELCQVFGIPLDTKWYTGERKRRRICADAHYVKPTDYAKAQLRILQDRAKRLIKEGLRNGSLLG